MIKQTLMILIMIFSISLMAQTKKFIPADDPNLEYSDYAIIDFLPKMAVPMRTMAAPSPMAIP